MATAAGDLPCHYEILGLERTCTDGDIKKAYRKLALRWHPDKNAGSEEASSFFKLISNAYQVLSDPEKRNVYDCYGHAGLDAGMPSGGFDDGFGDFAGGRSRSRGSMPHGFIDPDELFRAFFGTSFGDDFHQMGGHQQGRHQSQQSQGGFPGGPMFGGSMFGSMFGGSMFGGGDPFMMMGGLGNGAGMMSMSSSSSFGGGGGGSFSSSSSRTTIRNGKRVTTRTISQNGQTREEIEVADARTGEVLSLNINGEDQPIAGSLGYR